MDVLSMSMDLAIAMYGNAILIYEKWTTHSTWVVYEISLWTWYHRWDQKLFTIRCKLQQKTPKKIQNDLPMMLSIQCCSVVSVVSKDEVMFCIFFNKISIKHTQKIMRKFVAITCLGLRFVCKSKVLNPWNNTAEITIHEMKIVLYTAQHTHDCIHNSGMWGVCVCSILEFKQ